MIRSLVCVADTQIFTLSGASAVFLICTVVIVVSRRKLVANLTTRIHYTVKCK